MKAYKSLERQPKVLGLRQRDIILIFLLLILLLLAYIFLSDIGLSTGIYGFLFIILVVGGVSYILKTSNEKKCPNFLDAYMSYHLGTTHKINPHSPKIQKQGKK